jgi:hypothetical protein
MTAESTKAMFVAVSDAETQWMVEQRAAHPKARTDALLFIQIRTGLLLFREIGPPELL